MQTERLREYTITIYTFVKATAFIILWYFFSSNGCPNSTFCRTEAENNHGSWEMYAILPFTLIEPLDSGNSPIIVMSKEDWNYKYFKAWSKAADHSYLRHTVYI